MNLKNTLLFFRTKEVKVYLVILLWYIGIGLLSRLILLKMNNSFELEVDLLKALWLGARFDLSVGSYVLCIFIILKHFLDAFEAFASSINFVKCLKQQSQVILYFVLSLLFFFNLFIHVIDIGYFIYFKDRLSLMLFGFFEDDTWALIKTIWKDYPVLLMLLFIFLTQSVFQIHLKKLMPSNDQIISPMSRLKNTFKNKVNLVFRSFIIFLIFAVLARGSLGLFPLGDLDTAISKKDFYNLLGFNSVHALGKAIRLKSEQKSKWNSNLIFYGYGSDYKKAFNDFSNFLNTEASFTKTENKSNDEVLKNFNELIYIQQKSNPLVQIVNSNSPPHLILILMESFGTYGLREQSQEFNLLGNLKKHFDTDFVTYNFLSATGATIGSLSSLLNGAPHRPISEFLTESQYQYLPLVTSPATTLKQLGYQSRFIYGGNPGWRDVNKYARVQGFDFIDGDIEIKKHITIQENHDWGIFDHDLFQYVQFVLKNATQPQFLVVMTTTNHPPYTLPNSYPTPRDLKAPAILTMNWTNSQTAIKRLMALRYANDSLGQFLSNIKTSDLHSKVQIAVTGDHTFWLAPTSQEDLLLNNSVPLYLYSPTKKYPKPNVFGSHQDILPTLYDMSGLNFNYYSFGKSLYQNSKLKVAFNHSNMAFSKDGAVIIHNSNTFSPYCWEPNHESQLRTSSKVQPCTANENHQELFSYYKSLMGSLDGFYKISTDQQK